MKNRIPFGAARLSAIGMVVFLGAAMAQDHASAVDERREVFLRVCGACHSADQVDARRTRSQWEDLMYKMIDLGAKGTDKEYRTILDYLTSEYGRVNVNRGSANELSAVLGLTTQQANVILNYRREHGKYENFDAFAKTPGLDAAKLEKFREALSY